MVEEQGPTYEELKRHLLEAEAATDESAYSYIRELNEELQRSQENFRNSVDASPLGVGIIQEDGRIIYANTALLDIYGYDNLEELNNIPLERRQTPESYKALINQKMRAHSGEPVPHSLELDIICKDESKRRCETFYSEILWNGSKKLMMMYRDVTESRKIEEALRESREFNATLLKSMTHATIVVNPDTSIRYVNPAWEKRNGWTMEEVAGIKAPYPWWPEEQKKEYLEGFKKALKQDSGQVEGICQKKSGERYWITINSTPVMHEGELQYVLINSVDINESRRAHQLQRDETHVLTLLSQDAELKEILDSIISLAEVHNPDIKGSVLLFDSIEEKLVLASAPNLPEEYLSPSKDGLPIGPDMGSCGTAAYRRERVIVPDITNSPLFRQTGDIDFVKLLTDSNLLATWTEPIISSKGELLGTIANYSSKAGEPTEDNLNMLEWSARVAAIAIEAKNAHEELRESEEKYRAVVEDASIGIVIIQDNRVVLINQCLLDILGYTKEEFLKLDYMSLVHPDDSALTSEYIRLTGAVHNGMKQIRVLTKSGEIKWVEASAVRIQLNGRPAIQVFVLDVTERKEAEEALRYERDFAQSLINTAQAIILILDTDGRITHFNPHMSEISGYCLEEVKGKDWFETFLPERDRARIRNLFREAIGDIQTRGNINPIITKDGQERDIEWYDKTLKDNSGTVIGLLAIGQDITERNQAEKALRKSEEKFSIAFRSSPDRIAISTLDDGRIVEVNDAFLIDTGYTRKEIIGRTGSELNLWTKPEQRERIIKKLKAKEKVYNEEVELQSKEGRTIIALFSAETIEIAGEMCMLSLSSDITLRRQAEEKLRENEKILHDIFNGIQDGISLLDTDFNIIRANSWMENMYWEEMPLGGRKCYEAYQRRSSPCPWCPSIRAIESGEVQIEIIPYPSADNPTAWFELSAYPMKDSDSHVNGVVEHVRDITERKKIAEDLDVERRESRLIIDSSPVFIFYKDTEGKFVRVNKALSDALELDEEEIIGKTVFDIYPPELAKNMTKNDHEVLNTRKPKRNILEQAKYPGGARWILTNKVPILNQAGIPTGLIGFAQDINERVLVEEALRESEEKYRAVVENANVGITVFQDRRTVFYNPWVYKMLGYTQEEATLMEFADTIHPDDFALVKRRRIERLRGGNVNEPIEFRVLTKFGEVKWLEASTAKIMWNGKPAVQIFTSDITERKRAEETLRKSEEKFFKAFRSSPDRIVISTLEESRIIDVNDSYVRYTGHTRDEVIGHTMKELDSWVNYEERSRIIEKLKKSGRVADEEVKFRRKSGEILTSLFSAEVIDIEGVPCMISVATDITQRKKAEEALANEAIRRRILVEQSKDGIVVLNQDGSAYEANQQFAAMLGYTIDEVRQLYVWDWDNTLPKEQLKEMLRTVDESGDHFETKHIRKNGTTFDVEISTNGAYFGGQKLVFCVCRDITKRKQAEKELRDKAVLLDILNDAVITTDMDYNILTWNSAAEEMYGWPAKKVIGRNVYEIGPTVYINTEEAAVRKEIRENGFWKGEAIQQTRDGRDIYVFSSIFVIKDENGKAVGSMAINRDITERKNLEFEQRRVEKLESVGTLAGGIAHDFNNLLTSIMGNVGLAKRLVESGDKAYERLEEAEKAAARARDLTQQLLTFAKGGLPVKKLATIPELITETATFALRGSNVMLKFDFPDELWTARVDPGQLGQVINNMVLNAQEAMFKGGVIHISGGNVVLTKQNGLPMPDGNYVRIDIKDEGKGIAAENLKRIFEPYFTTKQKGSGLGLATAYSIISNHGGYISVESKQKKGTTFHIYLPASGRVATPKKPAAKTSQYQGSGNILVMDDEETVRNMLGRLLSAAGYIVELAGDGAEAVSKYSKAKKAGEPFDAVILDLTVPGGMGGKDTVISLRKIDPEAKVIVSSGFATDPIMAEHRKHGFDAVVAKPYSVSELEKTLHDLLKE